MPASRYVGEFVCRDISAGRQFLCNKIWSWSKGDGLTGFVLAGTTVPTIDAQGRINLYDAVAGAGNSGLYITVPNTRDIYYVLSFKLMKQVDDTSTPNLAFNCYIAGSAPGMATTPGHGYYTRPAAVNSAHHWWTSLGGGTGPSNSPAFLPVAGVEYQICLILAPNEVLLIVDGVLLSTLYFGAQGVGLSLTPRMDWLKGNKTIDFDVQHNAGQVSHFTVHDIKVGTLAGQGGL